MTRTNYVKMENGAPERSRTPNLLIRSQVLYPIELRVRIKVNYMDRLTYRTKHINCQGYLRKGRLQKSMNKDH